MQKAKKKPTKKDNGQVGRKAYMEVGKILVEVVIIKYEWSFGRDRYMVKPVSGKGQAVVQKLKDFHD